VRQVRSAPLVAELEEWMRGERAKLSRHAPSHRDRLHARALEWLHTLPRRRARLHHEQHTAERALRGLALGRKSWIFVGSQRGANRAAVMYTLIATARLNDIDPQAWLADVLARIADTPQSRLCQAK
jgi:transposase